MSAPCDHLLGYIGWEGEIELRVSDLPAQVARERKRLQTWLDKSGDRPWVGRDNLRTVKRQLRQGGAALLEDTDIFKFCPECGARIPSRRELLP